MRAVLMALSGTPLPGQCALLVAVVLPAPRHTAAQGAPGIAVALLVADAHEWSRGIGDGPTCCGAVARAAG